MYLDSRRGAWWTTSSGRAASPNDLVSSIQSSIGPIRDEQWRLQPTFTRRWPIQRAFPVKMSLHSGKKMLMIAGKFEIVWTVELILTSSMAAEKELKLELHQIEPFTLTPAKFVAILISIIFIFQLSRWKRRRPASHQRDWESWFLLFVGFWKSTKLPEQYIL